jgi:outer membrane protein OmpA-like peptidoglycan-associated protein
LYGGLMTEYNSGKVLGGQLRVALDDRRVAFNDWDVNGTGSTRFSARMTYVSVEPSLRINLGSPDFHMVAGPLLSFKVSTKYDYTPGRDETAPSIQGQDIPGTNNFTYGVSGGFGYDININSKSLSGTKWYLTPFVEASYMLDQRKNDFAAQNRNDTWVTTSIRGGFQLKFGSGVAAAEPTPPVAEATPEMNMQVRVPPSVIESQRVVELFPLRNYIFFDANSTDIPARYPRLSPTQAESFTESSLLQVPVTGTAQTEGDRSQRQMSVYYNGLNVYGERLRSNPTATIRLVGSAPTKADGLAMANSVRDYLTSTFGIDPSRITTDGQIRPPHASGTRVTPTEDLDLVAEENRRVEVLSDNLDILKPVRLDNVQLTAYDNDIIMNVTTMPTSTWTARISGEGFNRTYGPYSGSTQRIDAKEVLQSRDNGNYMAEVTMVGPDGQTITKTTNFSLVKKDMPPITGQRYSILFEYDEAKTVQTYEKFLRETVAPLIPDNATLVIHGHTDKVGTTDYNFDLSTRRATETQKVLEDELGKIGRRVNFDSYGFGEDEGRAPFTNSSPEGRYYDRTVMIEVIPNS